MRSKSDADPKVKKEDQDSIDQPTTRRDQASSTTAQVTITKVVHGGDKMEVSGKVENLSTAAKTYALKVQFMDASGKVLATQDVPPLAVSPHASQPFDVMVTQPGVIAYKYAPLD